MTSAAMLTPVPRCLISCGARRHETKGQGQGQRRQGPAAAEDHAKRGTEAAKAEMNMAEFAPGTGQANPVPDPFELSA
jgi:hypothetical protein